MRILFLTSSVEDYLADGLLLGFRSIFGSNVVDYPKAEILYKNCSTATSKQVRGNGFTLYSGILEEIDVDRFKIVKKVQNDYYDLIIFSDIWRQYGFFLMLRPWLSPRKAIILDGADTPQVYPYAGLWFRYPYSWFLPRAHRKFLYFKREWTRDSQFNLWHRFLPIGLSSFLPSHANLRRINFSIPEEKILKNLPQKRKKFAIHCVDSEVAEKIPGCKTSYAFKDEAAYYGDLRASRFAVTTKRAGWDCLRHYEIAANGCIPCFRDLDKKPENCAPHGLNSSNCIIYHSAEDLFNQVQNISIDQEYNIRKQALRWASEHTCDSVAQSILRQINLPLS